MAYRDLRDFLNTLDKKDELRKIGIEVDPVFEITDISDRTVKVGGPALLFEKPKGSRVPVVTNLVGTEKRMCLALEVDSLEEIADRVHSFIDLQSPQGIFEKIKMLPKLAEIGSFFPKIVRSGACQEVVRTEGFSLDYFPILKCWPQDGGRFITWPMVITKNPDTGKRNVGCYRMQVFDERSTGMHWQTQKHGADHYRNSRGKNPNGRLEVAVAIGADPATALAGILPVPPDMDEFLFSGFLRRDPVDLVPCKTVDLEVPANAEIVSKVTSKSARPESKAPSAITPVSIRWKGTTRSSTSNASPTKKTRSTSPPSSARLRKKTISWATPSNASSCR